MRPKSDQERPKGPQERPEASQKATPRGRHDHVAPTVAPKEAARVHKSAPRTPKRAWERPKDPQEHPQAHQKATPRGQHDHVAPVVAPKRPQELTRALQGPPKALRSAPRTPKSAQERLHGGPTAPRGARQGGPRALDRPDQKRHHYKLSFCTGAHLRSQPHPRTLPYTQPHTHGTRA